MVFLCQINRAFIKLTLYLLTKHAPCQTAKILKKNFFLNGILIKLFTKKKQQQNIQAIIFIRFFPTLCINLSRSLYNSIPNTCSCCCCCKKNRKTAAANNNNNNHNKHGQTNGRTDRRSLNNKIIL